VGTRNPETHRKSAFSRPVRKRGTNVVDRYRRSAGDFEKNLKGAKPSELPIQEPELFDIAVNLTAAQTLELTIPESILIRATEVIH
jgi:putative ABC transport system substrate-binding protein